MSSLVAINSDRGSFDSLCLVHEARLVVCLHALADRYSLWFPLDRILGEVSGVGPDETVLWFPQVCATSEVSGVVVTDFRTRRQDGTGSIAGLRRADAESLHNGVNTSQVTDTVRG